MKNLIRVTLLALLFVVSAVPPVLAQEETSQAVETENDNGFDWDLLGLLGLLGLLPRKPIVERVTRRQPVERVV